MKITRTPSISVLILYPLLILLFFITIQARKLDETSCSSSCGEIQKITYPFRLKTDPSNCGDRDYELSCVNNKTILDFKGGKYFVQKITYDIHRIRIVDVNFANGSCNIPSGRLKSVEELDVDYRYPGYTNLSSVGFMNCSRNTSTLNNFTRVPCSSRNGSFVYAVHYNSYTIPELNGTYCKPMSMVPIDYYPEDGKLSSSFDSILKPLQSGFELLWSVECRDCSLLDQHQCIIPDWEKPWIFKCKKIVGKYLINYSVLGCMNLFV